MLQDLLKCAAFIALVLVCLPVRAQPPSGNSNVFRVDGNISDSLTYTPMELVTATVLDETGSEVTSALTDVQGRFSVVLSKKGSYILHVSFVGYRSRSIPFFVTGEEVNLRIPTIFLAADIRLLEGVTVTGRKQLVETRPGMLIYHADKDVTNLGGNAADVLRKAPALTVDADGNVSMRGSSSIRILINGKYSGQMARSPADALNMIPADMIRSVEIVTSPSARYEAEGTAGVINIITKKTAEPLNGALELVGGNLDLIFNPRAGFARGKWVVNTYGHLHRSRVKRQSTFTRFPLDEGSSAATVGQTSYSDNFRPHGMLDLGVDYEADSSNLLSLSASAWFGNWPVNSMQENTSGRGRETALQYRQQTGTSGAPNEGIDLNLSYTHKFRKKGRELFIIGQYMNNFRDDFNYDTWHRDANGGLLYRERNHNHLQTVERTIQADYTHPLFANGKSTLQTGLKAIFRDVESAYSTWAAGSGNPASMLPVPGRTDVFGYRQDVMAGYAQVQLDAGAGWIVQAGGRLESTFLEGEFLSAGVPFRNRFRNFVPNVTISKKLNDTQRISLNYTQRISRPSILDLNPNIDARDSRNLVSGNPGLRPETSHQGELSYTLSTGKGLFLHTGLYGRKTNNAIENVVTVDAAGVSLSTRQNLAANSLYGVNLSASSGILPGWSWGTNVRAGYLDFRSRALNIAGKGWGWGINLNTTCKFMKYYTAQLFGDYDSRVVTLQGYDTDWFYYSMAIKREWPGTGLTAGLTTVNPFAPYAVRGNVWYGSGYTTETSVRRYNRAVRLTLNWVFGESGRQAKRKAVRNDDLKSGSER